MSAESRKNATGAGDEFWIVFGVIRAPDLVGGGPFVFGKFCGAIDAIPVWRIVLFEFGKAPGNVHSAKHGEVGGSVGGVGVEERAVPIEEDATKGGAFSGRHFFIRVPHSTALVLFLCKYTQPLQAGLNCAAPPALNLGGPNGR